MTKTHNLGFPRIGAKRELKFALESYWKGRSSREALETLGADLRRRHWSQQAGLDLVPVGDFAFYDQVLDNSACGGVAAGEMTKWFDTNYHYIVPELSAATAFELDASRLLEQLSEAKALGVTIKPKTLRASV